MPSDLNRDTRERRIIGSPEGMTSRESSPDAPQRARNQAAGIQRVRQTSSNVMNLKPDVKPTAPSSEQHLGRAPPRT